MDDDWSGPPHDWKVDGQWGRGAHHRLLETRVRCGRCGLVDVVSHHVDLWPWSGKERDDAGRSCGERVASSVMRT